MTALRKFLPSESDWSEIAKAHHGFIRALNAPIPSDVLAVMLFESFKRETYPALAFNFPQTLCQRGSKAIRPSIAVEGE